MLSVYLLQLTDSAKYVGFAEGTQGMCMAMIAVPSGFLADKLGRERILRVAAIVGLLATATVSFALWCTGGEQQVYELMVVGLGLCGLYNGLSSPALDALFADSIATGDRSALYTAKQMCVFLASAAGPLANVALFAYFGDAWSQDAIRAVMQTGLCIGLTGICMTCLFADANTLGHESESCRTQPTSSAAREQLENQEIDTVARAEGDDCGEGAAACPEMEGAGARERERDEQLSVASTPLEETDGGRGEFAADEEARSRDRWIPAIVVTSDIIMALASGMTIKFFPLFFQLQTKMQPVVRPLLSFLLFLPPSLLPPPPSLNKRVGTSSSALPPSLLSFHSPPLAPAHPPLTNAGAQFHLRRNTVSAFALFLSGAEGLHSGRPGPHIAPLQGCRRGSPRSHGRDARVVVAPRDYRAHLHCAHVPHEFHRTLDEVCAHGLRL